MEWRRRRKCFKEDKRRDYRLREMKNEIVKVQWIEKVLVGYTGLNEKKEVERS